MDLESSTIVIFEKKEEESCTCHKASWTDYPYLQDILPPDYEYKVCSYTNADNERGFEVTLRLPFLSVEVLMEWKKNLERKSACFFWTLRTYHCTGFSNIYKKAFCCHHHTKKGCKAQFVITVQRPVRKGLTDKHLPDLPTTIALKWDHNHPRDAPVGTRLGDVNEDTKKQLISFYNEGHNAVSALSLYRKKLMKETGKSQEVLSKDKNSWPEKIFVMRLFRNLKYKQRKSKLDRESAEKKHTEKISKTLQKKEKNLDGSPKTKVLPKRNLNCVENFKKKTEKDVMPCFCHLAPWEHYPHLKDILPPDYEYKVCHYISTQNPGSFEALLRLPFLPTEAALDWKTNLENKSMCLFRSIRSYTCTGQINFFKKAYGCQRNRSRGSGKKTTVKTGCNAQFIITVRRPIFERSADSHMPDLPTTVFLKWDHNHPRNTFLAMRGIDVSDDTKEQFVSLFNVGHSPLSALALYRQKLIRETGESEETLSKDQRIWPEKIYVYRLFRALRCKHKKSDVDSTAGTVECHPQVVCGGNRLPVDVILPAAGTSNRMGAVSASVPKQFQKVLGTHLIAYTVDCFHRIPWIRHIMVVVSPSQELYALDLVKTYGWSKVRVCHGSHTRHRSIRMGVESLKKACKDDNIVIIHDGARPFVPEDIIKKVVAAAQKHGAAGVVRPLVSTVVKPDKEDILESTLPRSLYSNSEMPQAFQYHVIANAYKQCSNHDLDYGTECLLLALQYSDYRAYLVEGHPDLWKVTYAKDLFTMESVVKEKFTRLCITGNTAGEIPYLESLQARLKERQIKICDADNKAANTTICFLDLPSSSLSNPHSDWMDQLSNDYKKLPRMHQRLGLYIIIVFVAPSNSDELLDEDAFMTTDDGHNSCLSPTTGKQSQSHPNGTNAPSPSLPQQHHHHQPPQKSSTQLPQPLMQQKLLLQQQRQLLQQQLRLLGQQQQLLDKQIHSDPSSSTHPIPDAGLKEEQQRRAASHVQNHFYCQNPSQQHPPSSTTVTVNKNKSDSRVSSVGNNSGGNNKDKDKIHHHHHTRFSSKTQQQKSESVEQLLAMECDDDNDEDGNNDENDDFEEQVEEDGIVYSDPFETNFHLSNRIQLAVRSSLSPYQDRISDNTDNEKECVVKQEMPNCSVDIDTSNSHNDDGAVSSMSVPSNSMVPYIPECQDFMRETCQIFRNNSISDTCITAILSQRGDDLTTKLVELIWTRSRILHGQVLLT